MTTEPITSDARNELLVESLQEKPTWDEVKDSVNSPDASRRLASITKQEWFTAVVYLIADIATWALLYGTIGYVRRDAFFVSPLDFVLVDLVTLGVLLQALYIIGGYNRNTETRSLAYVMEHTLAIIGAAAVSSLLIYSAAAYDQAMKPSRGVLLLSFTLFLPISLFYRRWMGKHVAATIANRAFLVIGSGERAAQFYRSYKDSPNRQWLHFVDTAVDRIGKPIAGEGSPIVIKPLYYFCDAQRGSFLFASELKPLLRTGLAPKNLCARGLFGFFCNGSVPEPYTLIDNARCVEAGSTIIWRDGNLTCSPYWQLAFRRNPEISRSASEAVTATREALLDSVAHHFVSDVPVGIFLSGGVDSTALVALARASGQTGDLRTFSIGTDDEARNEAGIARRTAEHFGTKHTELMLNARTARPLFNQFLQSIDQPPWTASILSPFPNSHTKPT